MESNTTIPPKTKSTLPRLLTRKEKQFVSQTPTITEGGNANTNNCDNGEKMKTTVKKEQKIAKTGENKQDKGKKSHRLNQTTTRKLTQ